MPGLNSRIVRIEALAAERRDQAAAARFEVFAEWRAANWTDAEEVLWLRWALNLPAPKAPDGVEELRAEYPPLTPAEELSFYSMWSAIPNEIRPVGAPDDAY